VASESGQGAEFRVYLPATSDAPAPLTEPIGRAVRGGSETILLVEDEAALRDKLSSVLRAAGYRVLQASNGDEAFGLTLREAGPIHLLLADVVMPGISGPRLADQLRPFRPDTRVLFMSGYPNASGFGPALQTSPNFIPKPFTQESILQRVRDVLDSPAPPPDLPELKQ
jgi:DNA-binding NtrC family response regulator